MGRSKDEEIEKEENWIALCRAKGWNCAYCEAIPERGHPFPGKICEWCRGHLALD